MPCCGNKNCRDQDEDPVGVFGPKVGLYDPSLEKDACGVGMVAQLSAEPSHQIVKDGIEILERMAHRGGCGCDVNSGDGAGLLLSMPDSFFRRALKQDSGVELPESGKYAVGPVFLPQDFKLRQECKLHIQEVIERYGQKFIAWRKVPVNNEQLGATSRSTEPFTEQMFIEQAEGTTEKEFDIALYLIRRQIPRDAPAKLYCLSLSSKTIVYKGQLTPAQVNLYYIDLGQKDFACHLAIAHSRFSTNTFPSWERAQPLRTIAHNGEINTLRGNLNWVRSREGMMKSNIIGDEEMKKLFPVIEADLSDSGSFDCMLELLQHSGRSIAEAVLMMVPQPWEKTQEMTKDVRDFYEFNANIIEPWDGPAFIGFTDGRVAGAVLDRNGLRPGRFWVTKHGKVVLASEVGVLDIPDEDIIQKGRLTPGEMFLCDFVNKRIVNDKEIKHNMAQAAPYGKYLKQHRISLPTEEDEGTVAKLLSERAGNITVVQQLQMFGFGREQIEVLLGPMVSQAYEALGSMGNDMALACLSTQPRSIFDYFQQMFAQVTNPPIDPIREEIVMSLRCCIGPEGNLLESTPEACARVVLEEPVLGPTAFHNLTHIKKAGWVPAFVDITWAQAEGPAGLEKAIERVCSEAENKIRDGAKLVVLTDRAAGPDRVPIPSLMAVGAVHQQLVRHSMRLRAGLIVECGDAFEVHHMCSMVGFGCDAIYPYTVFEASEVIQMGAKKKLSQLKVVKNYIKSVHKGMLKVFAKMGISTLQSYKGAQIFEAVGIGKEVIDVCFTRCASRIGGLDFEAFAIDIMGFHARAFPNKEENEVSNNVLPNHGQYHWRAGDKVETHLNHPDAIAALQDAARDNNVASYKTFANTTNALAGLCCIRGQVQVKKEGEWDAIPLSKVEPAKEIVKRFSTGAMSYGSISIESHSTLAVAMNRLGGRSNTGEGGEHISRYGDTPEARETRSAIKQVASGRFGVTIHYLTNSDEIQIKMAQGAKPGEGGELPGYKVVGEIAKTRMSTEGVGLISPPPHHDIYSIEDLSQLIFDLKNANPSARISVKLVSEVGVGVIAAGVAKGMADHILISGHDGGTGASKWTGLKHAGLPFELGIAEAHQVLVKNGLRSRVVLQTDGQLKTGLDILKAGMLGAEEFCLATAPLIAMGCIMMRKCHLNTCPVGIATQDPQLRKMFAGQPEHVMNYLFMMAEEVRGYMAALGIATFDELVGRADLLEPVQQNRVKTKGLDFSALLVNAQTLNPESPMVCTQAQEHAIDTVLDRRIIKRIGASLLAGEKVRADFPICNTDRTVGTILSHELTKKWGINGLPQDHVHLRFKGSAGQSYGAFLAPGITMELNGDANDYVGKGLSGGRIIIYPPKDSNFKAEANMIVGNVCLYGATSGQCFFRGQASQRFCVRNSGAHCVVEGVGDHCCEYMTGGVVVCLGKTGVNFGAGMSGGIAFIYDSDGKFEERVNPGLVQLEEVSESADLELLKGLVDQHRTYTGSAVADRLMWDWENSLKKFVKVIPVDYKRVIERKKKEAKAKAAEEKRQQAEGAKKKQADGQAPALDIESIKLAAPPRPVGVPEPIKKRGFIEYERKTAPYRAAGERLSDFKEIYTKPDPVILKTQAARCMDCGVPFCHQTKTGCPLSNKIPEWNNLVYEGRWKEALERLLETNNFPEFTGRACPAPCEGACVLGIIENPVTIKNIECEIIDKGFEMGWVLPQVPKQRSGKKVAVIGSGPAGLACAHQLNKAGHYVTVFERSDRPGGLLMYGVPNMKLDKKLVVERRIDLMKSEGIVFKCNVNVGEDVKAADLKRDYDAVVMATGSTKARHLPVPGGDLKGIELAMNYLHPTTKSYLDSQLRDQKSIDAADKRVIVIGGGDTGNDCIGTAVRSGAKSVVNFELLPKPPKDRASGNPWPQWPKVYRIDYGHTEVKEKYGNDPRHFSILTKKFLDDGNGNVAGVETVQIQWAKDGEGRWKMKEIEGSSQTFKADLVFLAMGFVGPELGAADDLGLEVTKMGNYKAKMGEFKTSLDGVFACGDCRRGQSLIVWGIAEGRQCAREVDTFLMGSSTLP